MKKTCSIISPTFLISCYFSLFFSNTLYSQTKDEVFERITSKNGLPQSTINYIIQDKKGFIWFATYDGLNKYDGYTFKVYRNIVGDEKSLSSNGTAVLYEDRDGYIWVTNNVKTSLDKFDPVTESVTRYKHDPKDTTSISSNDIYHVMQDKSGNIWVCTQNALNLVVTEKRGDKTFTWFRRFYNAPNLAYTNIYEDRNGRLLLFADYLCYMDRKSYKITRSIKLDDSYKHSVSEDKSGNLWLGTHTTGIKKLAYDQRTQSYEYNILNKINVTPKNKNYVVIDDKEKIWIGTQTKGLFQYDIKEDRLVNFLNDKTDITSISDNNINCLFIDRSGILWIGTYGQGICKIDLYKKEFFHYKSIVGDKSSLSGNFITSIHSTKPGELWVSIDVAGGIDRFIFDHDKVQQVIHYRNNPHDNNTIPSNSIFCLLQRKDGEVWEGSINGFISKIIPEKPGNNNHPTIKTYKFEQWTFIIYEDRRGTLWGGTWNGGLWRYDDKTDKFIFYLNDPANPLSLCDNVIWAITEDNSGNIWIGGHSGGLSILPAKEKSKLTPEFVNFKNEVDKKNGLSDNTINVIFQDHMGTIWIGTSGGLNKVIIKDNNFRDINSNSKIEFFTYHIKDGLPSENIVGILEDNKDNLWISTSNGLSKFNIKKDSITNYYESDGLQSNEFGHNAYFKDQNGKMYFGGFNGINAFYPDSIKPNPFRPTVVFTDIKLFNKSVQIGEKINGDIIISKSINNLSEIILSHSNNVFTLEFAALHFTRPERNKYAFKLEGFDKNWNYVGNKREATYTNLEPGKYIFQVKASNYDGLWNEQSASIQIIILPPWWKTWWVKILILLILVSSVYIAFYLRIALYRKKQKELSLLVKQRTHDISQANDVLLERQTRIEEYAEELRAHTENLRDANELLLDKQKQIEIQAEQLKDTNQQLKYTNEQLKYTNEQLAVLNSTKDRFFSIIAHDLRNPFHTVAGFAEILIKDYKKLSPEKIERFLNIIYSSSVGGNNLLENLLQWSRSQTGRITYDPVKLKSFAISEDVLNLLAGDIQKKNIEVHQLIDQNIFVMADENMLKTIYRNLISNAIKFSYEKGTITLMSKIIDSQVELTVADTGTGIPDQNKHLLFRIDATVTTKGTADETGTGLGLILCKEFVERHGGKIWVESEEGKGSEFKFTLPLG
jgi:signal transduction histidine kinase/ligand-binding sensor domain-containing protein